MIDIFIHLWDNAGVGWSLEEVIVKKEENLVLYNKRRKGKGGERGGWRGEDKNVLAWDFYLFVEGDCFVESLIGVIIGKNKVTSCDFVYIVADGCLG